MQKSRRALLKLMGVGALAGASGGVFSTKAEAKTWDFSPKIAIIGAGLGGITISADLIKKLPKAKITLFDKDETFYYQPGFTLIAAGIYNLDDVRYEKAKLINEKVEWKKENIVKINPQNNQIISENNAIYDYDILIIASGVEYDFNAVEGLNKDDLENEEGNIATIYTPNSALKTQKLFNKIIKEGKANVLFSEQKTQNKCGGANKKLNFLLDDLLEQKSLKESVKTTLFTGGAAMLSSPIHAKMIEEFYIARKMPYHLLHNLVSVDKARGKAVFQRAYMLGGKRFESDEFVEKDFDYLFVIPTMKASAMMSEAGLSQNTGNWVDVDKFSLQQTSFKNIFAIGDVAGVPKGKTGASIHKQYPVISQNIIAFLEGKELKGKFSGYTACPLLTRYGKAVMVEFDYNGAAPSLECFGATRESYLNYFLKVYLMKTMVMQGMIYARA